MASRGPLLLGTLWLTAAVTATSVGLLAVHLVGNEVGGQVAAPLDAAGVHQALVSVSPTPSPAKESESESEHPVQQPAQGQARTVITDGGVLSARCAESRPRLLYATPADGFRTERGTQSVAFVGTSRRVTLTLTCSGEDLRATTTSERSGTRTAAPTPAVQPSATKAPEPSDTPDQPDNHVGLEPQSPEGN